jgi:SAM-dependent methyltransferase
MLNLVRKIRAKIMLILKPRSGYFMFEDKVRNLKPISNKSGFDRGTPIDRYYIDKFLSAHKDVVRGRCLEIHDDFYIRKFGGDKVTASDVLDIDTANKQANIYGDLKNVSNIADNVYDCLMITHTLGLIDDYDAAIREMHRILKPGGSLVAVVTIAGSTGKYDHWRFTENSLRYAFGKYFKQDAMQIQTYGNVLVGQAHWIGLATEELTTEELDYHDPQFAIMAAMVARKD